MVFPEKLRAAVILAIFGIVCVWCHSQVLVEVPSGHFKPQEEIKLRITNRLKRPIMICARYGPWSFRSDGHPDWIWRPGYIEWKKGHKWGVLLDTPDVGPHGKIIEMKAEESKLFPFRLSDEGEMRVVIEYISGGNDSICESPKGKKIAKSRIFWIEE